MDGTSLDNSHILENRHLLPSLIVSAIMDFSSAVEAKIQ